MLAEVESLLSSVSEAGSFLETPFGPQIARIIHSRTEPLEAGTRLTHYEIIEPIGAGGMGEVYLATDTRLNRKVALKLLTPSITTDKNRVSRFGRRLLPLPP